jgi:hypothetical protein
MCGVAAREAVCVCVLRVRRDHEWKKTPALLPAAIATPADRRQEGK